MLEGTIGTTLPSQLRLATDTVSLETWGRGEESCVGFNISSCLRKKQVLQANANTAAQEVKGVGVNFRSRLHRAGLPDGHLPQKPSGNSSGPLPWSTDHPDRTPLEISNLFPWESEHPSRNKVGSSL